jgi:aminopeptidase N
VRARSSWYPSANAFTERSTFDLTFKVPKRNKLVAVGKLVKEWKEEDYAASQWVSEVPLAVAGFNYGLFKQKSVTDTAIKYDVETYASEQVPGYLKEAAESINLTPSALADRAMGITQTSLRCFQKYFGDLPYGRIAITQQPEFFFGQSWPSLVYLPVSAFLDSTQRWALLGGSSFKFGEFIQEVTPHEVAHQWWGHVVGWASFHDQWLSEGFADFSAALYLHLTEKKPDKFIQFWERAQKTILDKNQFGVSANDAGPIWMGLRLHSNKNPYAYNSLAYAKGRFCSAHAAAINARQEDGRRGFHRDDARLCEDPIQSERFDRNVPAGGGEIHDAGNGPAGQQKARLVLHAVGVRQRDSAVQAGL